MMLTSVSAAIPLGVTSVQVWPSSRETWISPSSLPAQSTPRALADSAKAKIVA